MEGGNAARRAPEPKPSSTDRPIDRREAEQQTECAATAAGTDCCDCYCTARPVIACLRRADGQCLARCNLGSTSAGARPLPALFETARGRDAPSTARPRPALAHMLGARRVPPRVARAQEAGRAKNFATCCRRCLAHRAPCSAPCEPASVPRAPAALHDVRRERCGTAKCRCCAWPGPLAPGQSERYASPTGWPPLRTSAMGKAATKKRACVGQPMSGTIHPGLVSRRPCFVAVLSVLGVATPPGRPRFPRPPNAPHVNDGWVAAPQVSPAR